LEEIVLGALYLVSTPIGNLSDITYRAVHILSNVYLIAAEDTRVTSRLLQKYEIKNRMLSYHSYNLSRQTEKIIEILTQNRAVALVSDAGTPGILDPAYQLVTACIKNNIRIIPIPGPSAFLAALVTSGLPANQFVFEGFLPQKKGRQKRIKSLVAEKRTIIFYESPHRILKTLRELGEIMGNRSCVVARELTKKFEEIYRGTFSDAIHYFTESSPKGEFVLIVKGQNGNE
jgi:16S rRNA (cytidine1402-2'-O)-methyltransferase